MQQPLVNQKFLLKKIPGKGGWTYADLLQVKPDSKAPFGWVRVKGSIDGVAIKKYHLMPFGEGRLFLPVKAEIRKKIKKEAGDYVHVILYTDDEPIEIPPDFLLCLQDEPEALHFFNSLNESEKQQYISRIYSAKTEAVKVQRMAGTIERLLRKQKYYDQ